MEIQIKGDIHYDENAILDALKRVITRHREEIIEKAIEEFKAKVTEDSLSMARMIACRNPLDGTTSITISLAGSENKDDNKR